MYKILNFSKRFSCQHFAVEDSVTLPMGKNLVDGEMLCLGMVSTNLFRLFYAGETQNLNSVPVADGNTTSSAVSPTRREARPKYV